MSEYSTPKNPYRANRPWPPDFEKLGHKHQFRLERKYRRRLRNASLRPKWVRSIKLLQYGSCAGVVVFSVFFMDWSKFGYQPFEGIRGWAKNTLNVLGSRPEPSLRRINDEPSQPPRRDERR